MSLSERDDGKYEQLENSVERLFEVVDYDDIEEEVLKDMYVEIRSSYNLVQEWRDDDSIDWVVVDNYLEDVAEKAVKFCDAYKP